MDERDVPGLPLAHEHHEDEMRSETPVSIGPPPDGGREAWLVVFAAFFQQFCIFGMSESLLKRASVDSSLGEWSVAGVLPHPPTVALSKIHCIVSQPSRVVVY